MLLPRTDAPFAGDERALLDGFLAFQRSTVALKATGLTDELASRRLLPSVTTVIGLIQHLGDVERSWILDDLLGLPFETRWSDGDPDGEFRIEPGTTLAGALAEYEAACAETSLAIAGLPLDLRTRDGRFELRWVILHLIEETARHAGHIDILRELLDGETGE
ncbi:hypothetical protein GCM10025867_33330 [Frondihabitans sucicola]|uniref:DinB family protein n=1 Tax=Frondihabitans sucicola TaxID=1268041 RepID=A0ABM8GRK5_9MICO|nr:DinB family protein [Frondihabitans sucicola]BDZ51092.1 hypothetical protein GCM10025867_33330 [Frondihabitans sucicola]